MQTLDFAPLYRATVGFDRIADLMDRVLSTEVAQPTYPPYNIEKTAEDAYRISIAVAGFSPDELAVEVAAIAGELRHHAPGHGVHVPVVGLRRRRRRLAGDGERCGQEGSQEQGGAQLHGQGSGRAFGPRGRRRLRQSLDPGT